MTVTDMLCLVGVFINQLVLAWGDWRSRKRAAQALAIVNKGIV